MKILVIIRDHSILEDTIVGFMRVSLDVTCVSAQQTLKGPRQDLLYLQLFFSVYFKYICIIEVSANNDEYVLFD